MTTETQTEVLETKDVVETTEQETKEVDDKTKKLTLSQDDNINLMDFLNQIENNDAKVA